MAIVRLDVHGVGVEIVASEAVSGTISSLAEDFDYFVGTPTRVSLRLSCAGEAWKGPPPPRSLRVFRTRLCEVRELGWGRRWCGYGSLNGGGVEGAVVTEEARKDGPRSFLIYGATPEIEYELAYLALLSAIGEELDLRGFHRVHALGIERRGEAALVLLPRGGGKSAMALLGAEKGAFRVYSDENPLVRDGWVHPCPVRGALAPEVARALGITRPSRQFKRIAFPEKNLFQWEPAWIAREPRRVTKLLIGTPVVTGGPELRPLSKAAALPGLMKYLVVGHGLAQMAEHMLRPLAAPRLARISASRAREALKLLQGSELYRFSFTLDARANLAELERALGLT